MATKVKNMSFEQLVAAEKAANVVRTYYEDKTFIYRGVDYHTQMTEKQQRESTELSQKLALVNSVRLKIINEMEKKLLNIEYDE